jgi:hypothetical protein
LTYESSQLGIKIQYPLSWKVFSEQTWEGCFDKINTCVVTFAPNYTTELRPSMDIQFEIVKTSFKKDLLHTHNPCHNCDSLIDSVRYHYLGIVEGIAESPYSDSFEFIDDNQTTIGGNNSAWLIEYKESSRNTLD